MQQLRNQQTQAFKDIQGCLKIWADLLLEFFPDQVKCIYAKGSAIKSWDTAIDYVPVISDVDIHVEFIARPDTSLPLEELSFTTALDISSTYEDTFQRRNTSALHLPRVQIVDVAHLKQVVNYIPPRIKDVQFLYGTTTFASHHTLDEIRSIDKTQVLTDYPEFLTTLAGKAFDRTGLGYWTLLRQISWRISPAPVRLLTQLLPDVRSVWAWNRTRVQRELITAGYPSIASNYKAFYEEGWRLFLSNFSSSASFRHMLASGYHVLEETVEAMHNQV